MDKEEVILIFPDRDEIHALLASNSGRVQVFELSPEIRNEAFEQELADFVGISLKDATFDGALEELSERLTPVTLPPEMTNAIMVKAMFRFLMQKAA